MTVGFVRATKAYLLPAVLRDVYQFRKAFLTANAVLQSIFTSISTTSGTATAVATLRGDYREVSIDCQGFKPSGYSGVCPWGLLSFIEDSASSLGVIGTLSEIEVINTLLMPFLSLHPLTSTVRACVSSSNASRARPLLYKF